MEAELRDHLVELATLYGAAKKLEGATVGRLAAGDWRFFGRIQEGASFTARKYDEIVRWFARNWPDDALWPDGVPRPVSQDDPARTAA